MEYYEIVWRIQQAIAYALVYVSYRKWKKGEEFSAIYFAILAVFFGF